MAKKTRRLNGIKSLLAVAVGSLVVGSIGIFSIAMATAPFDDDFDTYTANQNLSGQGGWSCGGLTYVKNDASESAPNSVLSTSYNCYRRNGSSVADGEVYFYVKTDGHSGGWSNFTLLKSTETTSYAGVFWSTANGTLTEAYTGTSDWGTLTTGWNLIGIRWHYDATPANRWLKVSLNGSDFASGSATYQNYITSGTILTGEITGYSIGNSTGDYFDSITGTAPTPPVIEGWTPILTPTSPERNAETIVDFDDGFVVSGSIEIPTANTHAYDKLIITFRKPDAFFPAKTLTINLGGLIGGQSLNYSATTTIPITTSGINFFKVGYALTGSTYAGSYADNPPLNEDMLFTDNTWVKDSVEDAPAYLITPSIKPEQDALEDCGAYSGIDAVVCNLKNFIVGAFLPSDDALSQIGATMDALKNKFPMNYAAAVANTFSTISQGVDDYAGFSLTILGHTGSVDTSFFTQDIGGGATLGGIIKLVLTFLVFMIFLYWGINYMHRVLNK